MNTSLHDTEPRLDIRDISRLGEVDRINAVRTAQQSGVAARTVFLLSQDARRKATHVTHDIFDVDDTLTGSGDPTIPKTTVDRLTRNVSDGHVVSYLTGRHGRLVNPLLSAYPAVKATAYTELGAFRMDGPGQRENFLASAENEGELLIVRRHVHGMMKELGDRYGVVLQPNLGGEHESLDSHLVVRNGIELREDDDVLPRIMADIRSTLPVTGWEVRDSSRDTFDIVPAHITKANAMRRILEEQGLRDVNASFADDSPNGADVHRAFPGMTRAVVYGRKSRPEMLLHADIATAGTANVDPLLDFVHSVKRIG